MKFFSFLTFLLVIISPTIKAHECILSGTTPKEIMIYNSCLANSKQKTNNQSLNESILKVKIDKITNENLALKNKLLDLKFRFDKFKFILDSYIKNIN